MKKTLFMMALAATALFTTVACGSDDDDNSTSNDNGVTLTNPQYKNDAIKFEIPNVETTLPGGQPIRLKKLELTESGRFLATYQRIEADGSRTTRGESLLEYIYGLFSKDANGYTLTNFGHVSFEHDGSNYMLTLIPTGGQQISFEVKKLATIPASQMTDYLCRTWTITNTRIRGTINNVTIAKDFAGKCNMTELIAYAKEKGMKITEEPSADKSIIDGVTFTSSGSYIINYSSNKTDVGTWKWTQQSTGSGSLSYDWDGNHMGFDAIQHTAVVTFSSNNCQMALPISDKSSTLEVVYTLK